VIGVGIGGSEQDFPPEPFQQVYEQARKRGFHTSAHAGEADGPASVWGAVRALKVDRIGHGTRAGEDQALLDYLAVKQIPIEMCPISNVRTGVVALIAQHPIREYFERGLLVTVNTDDPKMFGNSLAEEYQVLVDRLGFSHDQVRRLIMNGIQASWLPAIQKADLARDFETDPGWL
jgi:adenosine deaminase